MLPILKVPEGSISKYVLVCGDPARVLKIAERLDDFEEIGYNREYRTVKGHYRGVEVTIASHGVGVPGAALAFEELIKGGAKTIIRVGTCGSLDPNIRDGDLVVATGAVREDGLTDQLVPIGYPAIADFSVVRSLEVALLGVRDVNYKTGMVLTLSAFYPGVLDLPLKLYSETNVTAVEMECSALFVIASLRGIRAGAILAVDGVVIDYNPDEYDPHRTVVHKAVDKAITAALNAVVKMASEE
ncbi:hypothetical protein BBF96_02950 [Anoxybacter fermentans]|uniref:Uridine phosphorylase n=2 Tax=Anoxybacter fermentans TaxID=1323375 RepID=A0A3S9T2P4_9FIRM|nr:hypothetical protein BBF96_02950 [Anoxybacter fermentans]